MRDLDYAPEDGKSFLGEERGSHEAANNIPRKLSLLIPNTTIPKTEPTPVVRPKLVSFTVYKLHSRVVPRTFALAHRAKSIIDSNSISLALGVSSFSL